MSAAGGIADGGPVPLPQWALALAERHLAAVPRRWRHAQGVVRRAGEVAPRLADDGDLLLAAAAVHDIGFAPEAAAVGFPAVDGARFLEKQGGPPRLVHLVAHSAASALEGELRGFGAEYADFEDERSPLRDALWWCCLTTGPDGEPVTLEERIAEWSIRYAGDAVIARYAELAPPELRAALARTEGLLGLS
ncbi:MAG TPA: HD domain-containing protein [Acidimicrobiia bacterium]|nr:HD domain-containing protein [Acidimicrobiia bacterium]